MAITKKEIHKSLSKIKQLDKAFSICILDTDLTERLALKMEEILEDLINRIISERNLNKYTINDLEKSLKSLKSHIKYGEYDEKSIYFDEIYKLTAKIRASITLIEVLVL